MQRLILSDIFGYTDSLQELADELSGSVKIIDPYDGQKMMFQNEAEAYEYFVVNVGLDAYREIVVGWIKEIAEPVTLLGFSVGASAIWSVSEDIGLGNVIGAVGFYGSQIRFNQGITPQFPVKLVFPSEEDHFDVLELAQTLSQKENVDVGVSQYRHGFMNKLSQNFNPAGYEKFAYPLRQLSEFESFTNITLSSDILPIQV